MLCVINVGLGNIGSILNMLDYLSIPAECCTNPSRIASYDHIILPGVGSFDEGVKRLTETGFDIAIKNALKNKDNKLLGICLGMQLLFEKSAEGSQKGLSLIPGEVIRFEPGDTKIKIPHMGWQRVQAEDDGLFRDIANPRFYFVHSYHARCRPEYVIGIAEYGYPFSSAVHLNNVYGVQFHPEKSHKYGMKLLSNFSKI